MTFPPASERARTVLTSNKYFVLAINDENGPWAATLAYTALPPNFLYFISQKTSRHGQALLEGANIAGVIYDSRSTFETAESLQFSGFGEVVRDPETIVYVLKAAAERDGQPAPTSEQISDQSKNASTLVYRVSIDEAFVLDQELFAEKGIDAGKKYRLKISSSCRAKPRHLNYLITRKIKREEAKVRRHKIVSSSDLRTFVFNSRNYSTKILTSKEYYPMLKSKKG